MKVSRQPKVSALLRIFAGTCALLWLVGIAVGGMEGVCNCAGHEGACAAVSAHEQRHTRPTQNTTSTPKCARTPRLPTHHDGAAPQPCAGKNGCKCGCSTIQTLILTKTPVVISEPVSQPVLNISLLCAAPQHVFAASPSEPLRQAKPRDWVFTPEVCLGPAFHSLAPPTLA